MASRTSRFIASWSAPTGVLISKVGMPVSWQIGASPSQAMSMLLAITESAVPALVAGFSASNAWAIARRTSGGRLVDVSLMSLMMLSLNDCMASPLRGKKKGSHTGPPRLLFARVRLHDEQRQEREEHERFDERQAEQ